MNILKALARYEARRLLRLVIIFAVIGVITLIRMIPFEQIKDLLTAEHETNAALDKYGDEIVELCTGRAVVCKNHQGSPMTA